MFFVGLLIFAFIANVLCVDVEVTTPLGIIRGTQQATNPNGKIYYSFKGIRYGTTERFEKAIRIKPWIKTYDAREDKAICVQMPVNGFNTLDPLIPESENCLFLSVNTPSLIPSKDNRLPVMVWIHGGLFAFGDSRYDSYGPDYFMDDQRVVLVSINYRLGVFGFLSSGDKRLPGNQAVKDVILALKWVKANIAAFGGNPNQITLFGQSAGAVLTSYVIQSPLTAEKGLINRAIIQSGSSLNTWSFQRDPLNVFWRTAFFAGCFYLHFELSLLCLKTTTIANLRSASAAVMGTNAGFILEILNGLAYSPCIETESPDAAVTLPSHKLLTSRYAPNIPILTGVTSEETILFDSMKHIMTSYYTQVDIDITRLVPKNMYASTLTTIIAAFTIRNYYFGGTSTLTSSLSQKYNFLSDVLFDKSWREYIDVLKSKSNVHCYVLSYDGYMGGYNVSYPGIGSVSHFEDLQYLFRTTASKGSNFPPADFENRKRMIRLWTNYAKFGNPTPLSNDDILGDVQWPIANQKGTNVKCLDIGANLIVVDNPQENQYQFWLKLFDTYGNIIDTY